MSTGVLSRGPSAPVLATVASRGAGPRWWWWAGLSAALLLAAVLRVWDGPATSGVGNSYYAAAALSMSQDWGAFFTGALDTELFVSLDKPPVWLWPSALLIKAFGMSWATLFLPSAVAGVLSVLVLALAVRDGFGAGTRARVAGLLSAIGLAVSPLNVAIDRNNNPDALMLFGLLLAAWLTLRAVRSGRLLPLVAAGALVGLAFNAKYVQAYMVLPGLVLAWMLVADTSVRRRLAGLGAAAASTLAVSAIWPVSIALLPAAQRPWIAGTVDGSMLTRLTSIVDIHLTPPLVPGGPAAFLINAFLSGEVFHAGPAGKSRLLSGVLADQVSWWLPLAAFAALVLAIGPLATGLRIAAGSGLVLWAGWLLSCWTVFSFMGGVLHPYYTSMLMPAVIALAASGLVVSWTHWRAGIPFGTATLVAQIALVSGWSVWVLVDTSAQRPDWLVPLVLAAGVLAAVLAAAVRPGAGTWVGPVTAVLVAIAVLTAPATWSVATARQELFGGNPLANQEDRYRPALLPPPVADGFMSQLDPEIDPSMVAHLIANKGESRWIAATLTAMAASPLILAADGEPVMALGGYDGRDPMPSLEFFRALVDSGAVRFVITPPAADGTTAFLQGPPITIVNWAGTACTPVDLGGGPTVSGAAVLLDCRGA